MVNRWWRWEDLNLRQRAYETPALPLSYTAADFTIQQLRGPWQSEAPERWPPALPQAWCQAVATDRRSLVPLARSALFRFRWQDVSLWTSMAGCTKASKLVFARDDVRTQHP